MAINDNTNKIGELINIINSLPVAGSGSGGSADGADKEILNVRWDYDAGRYSHTASEIISAANDGKTIIVDNSLDIIFDGEADGVAGFTYSYLTSENCIVKGYFYILDDGSRADDGYEYETSTVNVLYLRYAEGKLNEEQFNYIMHGVWNNNGLAVISHNYEVYKFDSYDEDNVYFVHTFCNTYTRYINTIAISNDGVISYFSRTEPIIPVLAEPEGGEVCTMHVDGTVSWDKPSSSGVLNVRYNYDTNRYSHTASEILDAHNQGKVIIVNGDPSILFTGYDGAAEFTYSYITNDNSVCTGSFYILEDGSEALNGYEYETTTIPVLYMDELSGTLPGDQYEYIYNSVPMSGGLSVISHDYNIYNYNSYDDHGFNFVHTSHDSTNRYTDTVSISWDDGAVTTSSITEPIIPVLAEPEGGEVLTMSNSGSVSWEKPSTKTLTEMLMEEDLILNERHFGDELPDYGTPGRIFFLRKSEV